MTSAQGITGETDLQGSRTLLEILCKKGKKVLGLRSAGVVRSSDFQDTMPELERILATTKPTGFLLDWTDLEAWSPEVEIDVFMIRISHRRTFERLSIVGAGRRRQEAATVEEIMHCEVRFFEPADEPAAWEWLKDA